MKKARARASYTHYIIALILGVLCIVLIHPTNILTSTGIGVIAVTITCMYLWLTCNTHWAILLYFALLVITQALTPAEMCAATLGNSAVMIVLVFILFAESLKQSGVIDKVAVWFVTRKFIRGKPYVFAMMFFASQMLVGFFMSDSSLCVIYLGLASAFCQAIGVKKGDEFYKFIFVGVLWVTAVTAIASPIAHASPIVLIGLIESQTGIAISYTQYLSIGIPFALIMLAAIALILNIIKPDGSAFKDFDIDELKKNNKPLTTEGKITVVVFITALLLILLPELLLSLAPTVFGYLKNLGAIIPAIIALTVLCIIHVNDKPILDMPNAMKAVPLPLLLFSGAISVMPTVLSSEKTGISAFLGSVLQPAMANIPSQLIIVVLIFIVALIMTNFVSNMVTLSLFFNVGAALLGGGSINLVAFGIAVGVTSFMGTLTPSSCPQAPLLYGQHFVFKDVFKHNLIFIIIAFIVVIIFVFPVASSILPT